MSGKRPSTVDVPCGRCGAVVREDLDFLREALGRGVNLRRLVCSGGHSSYRRLLELRGHRRLLELRGRKKTLYDGRNAPRPGSQARRRGIRTNTKHSRYRARLVAAGLCPHCGKPCAPYAECDARRARKRALSQARRERAGLFL